MASSAGSVGGRSGAGSFLASSVAGAGLTISGTSLAVQTDDSTLEVASDTVRVKDSGITRAKMASGIAGFLWQVRVGNASAAFPIAEQTISIAAAGTRYLFVQPILHNSGAGLATAEADALTTLTRACTITGGSIRVATNAATADGAFVLRKNGADTGITVTVAAGSTGVKNATGAAVSYAAGDTIAWKYVNGSGGAVTLGNWCTEGYTA